MPLPDALRRHLADTRPLRHPHYSRLWWANAITMVGAQLTVVTVPAQLWALTHDSGMVGLTGLFGLVPLLIFGLWGGALADHHDRRTLLLITTTGLILSSFLFFVQAALGNKNPWVLLALFALQQAFFGLNSPTRAAILPDIVGDDELPAANALNMTLMMFGGIAGPLLGGALLPILGYALLYLIDSLSLLATLYAVVKLPPLPAAGAAKDGSAPGLRSVLDGLGYAGRHPILAMSFVVDLIAMVCGMPRALFPQIANQNFGGPATGGMQLAALFAAIPVGAFLGGLFSGWVSRVRAQGKAVLLCIALWGVGVTAFGLAAHLARGSWFPLLIAAIGALAVGGAADMASGSFRQSILLQAASEEVRGRLQGLFFVVVVGGPRVADVVHGWAASLLPPGIAAALGGVVVMIGVAIVWALVPSFRGYRVLLAADAPAAAPADGASS